MTIAERADKAVQLKMFGGYNCSQAVTAALADQTGVSEEQLKSVAAGFCAGMGNLEATCDHHGHGEHEDHGCGHGNCHH